MTPVSSSNISVIPGSPFIIKKSNSPTRCHLSRKSGKQTFFSQRFALPPPTYVRLLPQYRRDCALLYNRPLLHIASATGTDVAVEEPNSPVTDEESGGVLLESTADSVEATKKSSSSSDASPTTAQVKHSRPGRKSEMPPVKDEDLVPGTMFIGKVKSIMPFGAFVDFGAFTDGLVHVSRLSDNFVKDVGSVVSIGQEVKVRLVEANMETGRISLSMRESDDVNKLLQQKDAPSTASSGKSKPVQKKQSKPSQRKEEMKVSKFVKGQELQGTVKNLVRAGSFISLPEGEEGFLPTEEESSDGFSHMMGDSSLQMGQEITVRVLRISRGQVTLTMRTNEDDQKSDTSFTQGVVHAATNPFVLAFRQNKEIAAFLEEREKTMETDNNSLKTGTSKEVQEVNQLVSEAQVQPTSTDEELPGVSTPVDEILKVEETYMVEVSQEAVVTSPDEDQETEDPGTSEVVDGVVEAVAAVEEVSAEDASEEVSVIDPDKDSVEPSSLKIVGGAALAAAGGGKATDEEASTEMVSEEASVIIPDQEIIEHTTSRILYGAAQAAAPTEKISSEEASKEVGVMDTDKDSIEPSSLKIVDGATQPAVPETEEISETLDGKIEESSDGESDTVAKIADQLSSVLDKKMQDDVSSSEEVPVKEKANSDEELESIESSLSQSVVEAIESITEKAVDSSGSSDLRPSLSTAVQTTEEVPSSDGVENEELFSLNEEVVSQDLTLESPASEELDTKPDDAIAKQEVKTETPSLESESPDENGSITDTEHQSDVSSTVEAKGEGETIEHSDPSEGTSEPERSSLESQTYGVTENQVESTQVEVQNETPVEAKISSASNTDTAPAENSTVGNSKGQNGSPSPQENKTKASISPALVKQLREETGAGMMDCKKALAETGGDIVKAQEFLRKKGLASAEKKASRVTAEGRIGSYIHDGRIGVLVEVNCETDFVSRGDIFKELVDDLAMQVAASPNVQYLVPEDVPKEIVSKEKEIEMQKEDLISKPEQIRSRIVEGRIRKRLEELALLEQPYIKNDKVVVKDWVKQTIATIGENIKVQRFVRYNLGQGLEKKSQDFAAEVAAQTAPKKVAAPTTEKPEATAAKETAQKSPAVTVSAALVKQLREETGAGMMDCKKALSETGGDLENAQEYLRKKGLAAADKKSSRLAAEGRIGSYIHDSRIGVLIEVNCETDFVGRSERFKELVDDLAMQVVACPQVQHVSIEDIPESIVKKEKELEMQREDLQSKPETIREKIVEGRVSKRLGELALLEQPFIKDDSVLVKDLVKQTIAALGENIKVRRFVRFTLGEASKDAKPETDV